MMVCGYVYAKRLLYSGKEDEGGMRGGCEVRCVRRAIGNKCRKKGKNRKRNLQVLQFSLVTIGGLLHLSRDLGGPFAIRLTDALLAFLLHDLWLFLW